MVSIFDVFFNLSGVGGYSGGASGKKLCRFEKWQSFKMIGIKKQVTVQTKGLLVPAPRCPWSQYRSKHCCDTVQLRIHYFTFTFSIISKIQTTHALEKQVINPSRLKQSVKKQPATAISIHMPIV